MTLFIGSLHLGLIYGLMALGISITFRILKTPDLTTDGSFTLGTAISASLAILGMPGYGILFAILCGGLAGAVTGLLQTKLNIHPILSGILTMSGLYSVNLYILGARSNVSLLGSEHLFSQAAALFPHINRNFVRLWVAFLLCAACFSVLTWFFRTHLGLCIRATGDNDDMVRASSIDVDRMRIIAVALSNACVGFSGAVAAQYQGFADIGGGVGMMVVGLASVIIGEMFFGHRSVTLGFLSAVCGSVVYRLIIALALKSDFFPAYALKLVSALIVVTALSLPAVRDRLRVFGLKREALRRKTLNQEALGEGELRADDR
ncbi:MAG: ABC transporter permease [Synergistaceae bacterium]|jgi:putative ABC transport system permease protein|nr:ABC transporter permease [Synergistaceae bacterium]